MLDELIDDLASSNLGCTMAGGVRSSVLAFADDVVLLAENEKNLQVLVDWAVDFFGCRGMAVNPAKCHVLVKKKVKGAVIPVTKTDVNIRPGAGQGPKTLLTPEVHTKLYVRSTFFCLKHKIIKRNLPFY